MTIAMQPLTRSAPSRQRQWRSTFLAPALLVVDASLVTASVLAALWGRENTDLFTSPAEISARLTVVGPLAIIGWISLIALVGGYRRDVLGAGTDEYKRIAHASVYAAALLGIGCYMVKFPLPRGFFLLLFVLGTPGLLAGRVLLRNALHAAHRRTWLIQRTVISGSPAHVDEIAAVLKRESWLGYHVVGAVTPSIYSGVETPAGIPVIGRAEALGEIVADDIDVVFFAGGAHTSANDMRQAVWELETHAVRMVMAPNMAEISSDRVRLRPMGGLPLVHVDPPSWADASHLGKRIFDIVGSLVVLLLASPFIITAVAWIRLYDGGPVLYRHTRVGRNGERFDCLKFRSMHADADRQLAALQRANGSNALLFKLVDDPRITRPGRLLRRFSIDELPQLLNVLRGDMSLVGPRPQVEAEVSLYDDAMRRRLHVRPGLTGLWQVSGRSDLCAEEAIRLDLYYVDNWSMLQDLSILTRTIGAVIGSRGAY